MPSWAHKKVFFHPGPSHKKSRSRNKYIIYDMIWWRRVFFTKKIQIPQQKYHIWYLLFLVRPESLLKGALWRKKDRDKWRRNLFLFIRSSAVHSLHICIFFRSRKKDMNPNTHERVLGKQQKAENQLFELKGSFWSGNSLNEFDKRSKLAFKWDAAAA